MRFSYPSLLTALSLLTAATTMTNTVVSAVQCTRGKLFLVDEEDNRLAIFDADTAPQDGYANPVFVETHHETLPTYRFCHATGTDLFVTVAHLAVNKESWEVDSPDKVGGLTFIDTGNRPGAHNLEVAKNTPKLVDFHMNCTKPIHIVGNDLKLGQFCDGSNDFDINSTIWLVDESKLIMGDPNPLLYSGTLPGSHHGVVAPLDDTHLLVSVATPERIAKEEGATEEPGGFQVFDYQTGEIVYGINDSEDSDRSCAGWHGDTHQGHTFGFACDEGHGGFLVVNYGGNPTYTSRLLNYPEGYEEHRSSFLKSSPGSPFFVGSFKKDDDHNLLAFDPLMDDTDLTPDQVQALPGKLYNYAFDYDFEKSGGQLLFAWLSSGNLQVYAMNPWTLVSDVQLVEGMTECATSFMVSGHGYAYVHVDRALYEVDVRDTASISVSSYDIGFQSHYGGIRQGVVAGVPKGYECPAPTVPDTPSEDREGAEGFVVLHFESHEAIAPGSASQAAFVRQFRSDLSQVLGVGVDRLYITEFRRQIKAHHGHHDPGTDHHDHGTDEDTIVGLFFANAGPHDVNQASGASLKKTLQRLLTESTVLTGTLAFLEGTVTDEPVDTESVAIVNDDQEAVKNDEWPIGAKAAVGVLGAVCFVALVIIFLLIKKGQSGQKQKAVALQEGEGLPEAATPNNATQVDFVDA